MKLIQFEDNEEKWLFGIDKVKYVIGSNSNSKYRLYKMLQHLLNKEDQSDYENENNNIKCLLNEQRLDLKVWKMYEYSNQSNLNDELKLSSKSLLVEYIESVFKEIDYEEMFIMLNESVKQFNFEFLNNCSLISESIELKLLLDEFTLKSLIKSMTPILLKEEMYANDFDLSNIEKIKLYIRIIDEIAHKNKNKEYLYIIQFEKVDHEFESMIHSIISDNLHILVFTNYISTKINYKDIYCVDRIKLDFAIEEELFQKLIIDCGTSYDIHDLHEMLEKLFGQGNWLEITEFIHNIA